MARESIVRLMDRAEGRMRWFAFDVGGCIIGSFVTRREARDARRNDTPRKARRRKAALLKRWHA